MNLEGPLLSVFVIFIVLVAVVLIKHLMLDTAKVGGADDKRTGKCLFAGSSSINSFWTKRGHVSAFPGATVKGLGKPDNEVRRELLDLAPKFSNIYLYFGEVDLMLSIFYDIERDKPADLDPFVDKFVSDRVAAYADFIHGLKQANPAVKAVVIVPWYNPVEEVEKWLVAHCVKVTPIMRQCFSRAFRDDLVNKFAAAVRVVPADKFIDIRDKIAPGGRMLDKYRPKNPVDHHLPNEIQQLLIAEGIFSFCGLGKPMPRRREYVPWCGRGGSIGASSQ